MSLAGRLAASEAGEESDVYESDETSLSSSTRTTDAYTTTLPHYFSSPSHTHKTAASAHVFDKPHTVEAEKDKTSVPDEPEMNEILERLSALEGDDLQSVLKALLRHPNKPILPQIQNWFELKALEMNTAQGADKTLAFDAETRDWNEMFQTLQVLLVTLSRL